MTVCAAFITASVLPAQAHPQFKDVPKEICNRDGEAVVSGAFVRNDWWAEQQCLLVDPGYPEFTVATDATARSGGVVSFPYIGYGWAWGAHSPGTLFPCKLSRAGWPLVTWKTAGNPVGAYNRALDIWFSRKPIETGQSTGGEIMVWLGARGYSHSPVYHSPIIHLDGQRWHFDWWMTNPKTHDGKSWPLLIFARVVMRGSTRALNVRTFADYAIKRGIMRQNVYWESILAGFERQIGGKGLRTTAFAVSHVAGGSVSPAS